MNAENINLKYKNLWLSIGFTLIAFVVYQTLISTPITVGMHISDKFLHTVGYFVMMGWFVQIFHGKKQRLMCALFFIAMGITLEFLQEMGGVRFYEVNDMLANGLGVVIAWILSHTVFSSSLLLFEKIVLKA